VLILTGDEAELAPVVVGPNMDTGVCDGEPVDLDGGAAEGVFGFTVDDPETPSLVTVTAGVVGG
jgi:hypothetical protein